MSNEMIRIKEVKKVVKDALTVSFDEEFCDKCPGGDCNDCIANKVHMNHMECVDGL